MSPKLSVQPRSWGTRFDTLPTSSPVSPSTRDALAPHPESSSTTSSPSMSKNKDEKLPHDASVFVGSLPSNVDHGELTQMLLDHLSEHIEVRNIKVIRDSKGGVCAFVQCEDAESASALIQNLHTGPPKPFLGRLLRYEPARAFRTLVISYRTPLQLPRHNGAGDRLVGPDSSRIELDLPHAMRLTGAKSSRFHNISYNDEAVQADRENADIFQSASGPKNDALFLCPLAFDSESIYKLASYFGPLENFCAYNLPESRTDRDVNHAKEDLWRQFPAPHDAPRSPQMDKLCWQVKWDHRDNCVNALMTLRRVPHLTVTWAHQPPAFGFNHRFSPTSFPHPSHVPHAESLPYALHPQTGFQSYEQQTRPENITHSMTRSQRGDYGRQIPHKQSSESQERLSSAPADDKKAKSELNDPEDALALRLASCTIEPVAKRQWGDEDMYEWEISAQPDGGTSTTEMSSLKTPSERDPAYSEDGQELCIPATPGLDMSPITPKTPGSLFPLTPTNSVGDLHGPSFKGQGYKERPQYAGEGHADRDIDPTTLFVGGLEMFGPGAWDEEKVKNFFSRFGGLESVKVVRPLNSCAAFAFVKFNNTESPARAVFEEHNRVYEGRAMRVQLRDCNPPRTSWKSGRGRGRYQNQSVKGNQLGSSRDEDNMDVSQGGEGPGSSHSFYDQPSEATNDAMNISSAHIADVFRETSPNSLGTTTELNSQAGAQHDSDVLTTSVQSPLGASVVAPPQAFPYPLSNGGYYATPPWMYHYAQYPHYQMPFYGGYPMTPQAPAAFTSPPGSDASGPAIGSQAAWPTVGMYGYMPYPMYPTITQNIDQPQPHLINDQASSVSTGYLQNDHGAVVQSDTVDPYIGAGYPPPHQSQHMQPVWQPPSQYHHYARPTLAPGTNASFRTFPSVSPTTNWVSNQAPPMQMHPQHGRGAYVSNAISPGGYHAPPHRRHTTHKANSLSNRQAYSRPFGSRNPLVGPYNASA